MMKALSRPRNPRLAVTASLVIVGAQLTYLLSLALNVAAGFPMPPVAATRTIASLSVIASAPAFLLLAWCLRGTRRNAIGDLSIVTAAAFAVISVLNRAVQLVVLSIVPVQTARSLDLYVTYSLGQDAEMLAWGLLFGATGLLVARAMSVSEVEAWPVRLLAASGVMALIAGLVYGAAVIGSLPEWVGGIGIAAGGAAWALLWPLSAALYASAMWHTHQGSTKFRKRPPRAPHRILG
ncbi:MAG TPA: hypothetical protein VLU92_02625 [Candidatus Dormibacteraeota bacterium]|nr:hypothetical protein [Candidatus Dormibacteraeota bacterium]